MKRFDLNVVRFLVAGGASVTLLAGCGSVDQNNQETEKQIEEETDSTVTNSEEAEITEESDQNIEADSNGSEATNTTGPMTLEEYLTEKTWLYRQDWPVSDEWDAHPDDSIQVCDMFFYNGMTFDYLYKELSESNAWGNNGFSMCLDGGILVEDFPENVPEDWNPKEFDFGAYFRTGNHETADYLEFYPEKYACYDEVQDIDTIYFDVFLYKEKYLEDDSLWNVTVLASTGSQTGDGLSYHYQRGTRTVLPTDDHAHLVQSCIRLSKDDVLVPYDLYGNYETE